MNANDIKNAAEGRWLDIVSKLTQLTGKELDGKGHPCPLCGGTDRFNAGKTFEKDGACFCRQCNLGGDGIHIVQLLNDWSFSTALKEIGQCIQSPSDTGHVAASTEVCHPADSKEAQHAKVNRQNVIDRMTRDLGKPAAVYDYHDADGSIDMTVCRWNTSDGKTFRPAHRNFSTGSWRIGARGSNRPLYNLPAVTDATTVFVAEGEKAADALISMGLIATTSAGGSNAASCTDWSPVDGKSVVIIPDNDESGKKYAEQVRKRIEKQASRANVRVLELTSCWPEVPEKGDAADWSEHFDGQPAEWFRKQLQLKLEISPPELDEHTHAAMASSAETESSDDWPELIPFDDPDLVRLEVRYLPSPLNDVIREVSEATETPPEMAAIVALGAVATATMRKFEVLIEHAFRQPLNLYTCTVLPPGNRKSAVFRTMFGPVHSRDDALRRDAHADRRRYLSEHEIYEKQCSTLRDRITKAKAGDVEALREQLEALQSDAPQVVHLPQLVCDDATPESICSLLSENVERIGVASAEPEIFDLIVGRYSKGPNVGIWLKGHEGDRHVENRRHRDLPIVLESPLMSVTVMAQPDAVQAAGENRAVQGRGLLERFMFVCPPSPVGSRKCIPRAADRFVLEEYNSRLNRLLAIDVPVDEFGRPRPRQLKLSDGAHDLWKSEQLRIEKSMAAGGSLSPLPGWGSKFPAQIARMAAILHLFENGPDASTVELKSMQSAIEVGRVVESHSRHVLRAIGQDPDVKTAQKVFRRISEEGMTEVTKREITRIDRTIDAAEAQSSIDLMVERGYLVRRDTRQKKQRGRPSQVYDVNPAVFNL